MGLEEQIPNCKHSITSSSYDGLDVENNSRSMNDLLRLFLRWFKGFPQDVISPPEKCWGGIPLKIFWIPSPFLSEPD